MSTHFEAENRKRLSESSFSYIVSALGLCLILVCGLIVSEIFRGENTYDKAAIVNTELIKLANESRIKNQLIVLQPNPVLQRAAEAKIDHMVSLQYFDHYAPDGTPWSDFIKNVGYRFEHAGENLAIDFNESRYVNKAWLESPSHRDNILSNNYTEIGIATRDIVLHGRDTTVVVQLFGKPLFSPPIQVVSDTKPLTQPKEVTSTKIEPKNDLLVSEPPSNPKQKVTRDQDEVKIKTTPLDKQKLKKALLVLQQVDTLPTSIKATILKLLAEMAN